MEDAMDQFDKLSRLAEETVANWKRELLEAAEDWRQSELLSPESFDVIMRTLTARDSRFLRRLLQLSDAHHAMHDGTDVNDYLTPWRPELRELLRADVAQIVEEVGGKL
jgi:hypothetical protein